MNKFGLLSAGLLAAVAAPAFAQSGSWMANNGMYVSAKGGYTQGQDISGVELDGGWSGTAAVGGKYFGHRMEVEGIYQESDIDTSGVGGETQFYGAMVNAYHDFENSTAFTPYLGAGAGYGKVRFSDTAAGSADEDVFAFQGIAGVGYQLDPCWTLTGEYRYIGTEEKNDARYQSHSALVGARYTF